MAQDPTFEVVTEADAELGDQLLFGVAHFGMAGVSATDYLVKQLDVEHVGYIKSRGVPAIAPLEAGAPRQPMRLYTSRESKLTILVSETFVPVWAAEAFVDGVLTWLRGTEIEELVSLYGVPFQHGPDQHRVFYTATTPFRESNLQDTDLEPLAGGFLDGVVGELVLRSLDGGAPPTGVFITPAHPPGPDLEGALLLLQAAEQVCDFDVDEEALRESADQMKQFYNELASRMEALSNEDQALSSRDYPEDRGYM